MNFIKFIGYGNGWKKNVILRVNRSIFISNAILRDIGCIAESFCYCDVYIDQNENKIGFDFLENSGARKLLKEKSGISINITPVLRVFKLKNCKRAELPYEIEHKMLVIDLTNIIDK